MQTFSAVGDSATPADGVEKQDGDKGGYQSTKHIIQILFKINIKCNVNK